MVGPEREVRTWFGQGFGHPEGRTPLRSRAAPSVLGFAPTKSVSLRVVASAPRPSRPARRRETTLSVLAVSRGFDMIQSQGLTADFPRPGAGSRVPAETAKKKWSIACSFGMVVAQPAILA